MGALCDNRQSQNISWLLSGHEKALHMCKIRIWVQIMRVMNVMVIWILMLVVVVLVKVDLVENKRIENR